MCTYYKNELIFQISWTDWFCCVNICIIFSNMKNYGAIFSVLWGERGPVIYCQCFPIRDVCFVCTEQQSDRCVPYIFISSVCPHFHFRLPSMLSVTTCTYCVTPPASLIAFLSSSCCFMIYCSLAVIYHFTCPQDLDLGLNLNITQRLATQKVFEVGNIKSLNSDMWKSPKIRKEVSCVCVGGMS